MFIPLLLCSPWAIAVQEPDQLTDRLALLQQRIEEARVEFHVPSVGFALVNRDGVLWAGGFGAADLESGRAANERTLYAIGSTTKAFTSTLIGDLVDEGRISWDVPAVEVVPQWTLEGSEGETITLRDLLSHRTGYPRMGLLFASGKAPSELILETAAGARPFRGYHETFLYNNIQYLAAGTAAANVADASWNALLETRFFDPLGMASTTTSFARATHDARRATGYRWDRDDEAHEALPPRNISNVGPAGSIYSNAADMARWVQFQLNMGNWQGEQIVSAESIEECWKSNIDIAPEVGYGMGWMLHDWQGQRWIEHGGNIDGYSAKVGMLPDAGYGFVMLCNLNGAGIQGRIDPIVWEALLGPLPGEDDTAVEAEALDLSPYLGKFVADFPPFNGESLETVDKDGALAVIVPGQGTFELKMPDDEGMWAWVLTDTIKMSFQQDEEHGVHTMVLHQGGAKLEMPREGYEVPIEVPLNELRPYLGTYRLAEKDEIWTVRLRNNRLAVDVPNQMAFELHAPDEEGWRAWRAVEDMATRFQLDPTGVPQGMQHMEKGTELYLEFVAGPEDGLPTLAEVYELLDPAGRGAAYAAWGGYTAKLEMLVQQSGVRGEMTVAADAEGRSIMTLDFGPFGMTKSALTLDSGWVQSDFEPFKVLNEQEVTEAMENSGMALAVGDFRTVYDEVLLDGKATFRDQECWVLIGKKGDRPPAKMWFDCEKGELIRLDAHVDLDGAGFMSIRIRMGDYRMVDGVKVPFRTEVINQATGRAIQQVLEIQPGVTPDPTAFESPEGV
ncbi:MAG: hypothetical protein CMJ94_12700 [Planctomycetes bacterium]|nr:hypothetical protein [Planctomycetota bacterium]